MDAYFAIASLRAVHEYSDEPLPDDALRRILEAGRAAGSSQNKQPWQFYVARDRTTLDRMAETVYAPENLHRCRAAVAIVLTGKGGFDAGRCGQNMMLAAWADGIGSSPNGVREPAELATILGLSDERSAVMVLSLGYPIKPPRSAGDTEGVLKRIKRNPLDELVVWVD
ncbi:MAG TPA: nitroreductase family protein [Chloroflexota bacterium]|jgi:nitroreductase|nr:nitroreductase family protein [Chloroflexota bacterium]